MACRGVGAQREGDAAAANARARERRALEYDLARRLAHLARGRAAQPGDALRRIRIGDDERARVERALLAVERRDRLAFARVAHHEACAGQR